MKNLCTLALLLAAATVAAAQGQTAATQQASSQPQAAANSGGIGQTVADFKLPDAAGGKHSLASVKGAKGTVLIFVSTQCPVSNAYNERMQQLAQDLKARGVAVVGINSNATEAPDVVRAHAAEKGLTFTILKDNGNKIADQLGATRTPEVYLLDANNRLVYRGSIDNSRNAQSVTTNHLRDAVEAMLAGKPIANAHVRAFGCSIKRAS